MSRNGRVIYRVGAGVSGGIDADPREPESVGKKMREEGSLEGGWMYN
jgi:hypothetical protein